MSKKLVIYHEYDGITYVEEKYMPLVAAILKCAEKDLKAAILKGKPNEAKSLRSFFLSDWGQALSNNNGQYIIRRIERECVHRNIGIDKTKL